MSDKFSINPVLQSAYERIEQNKKRLEALEVPEGIVPSDAIGVIGCSNRDLQSLLYILTLRSSFNSYPWSDSFALCSFGFETQTIPNSAVEVVASTSSGLEINL